MSYALALLHLTTSPDLRNFAMEALDRKGRYCSVCIRAVRGSMTRSMNDVVAMEAASLFMEEFVCRSIASPHMLLHGVWPKHPFDDAVERLSSFFEARFSPGGSLWRIGGGVVCYVMRGRCVRRPRNVRGRRCETAIRRGSFFGCVLGRGYSRVCLRLVARDGVCSCMPRWFP